MNISLAFACGSQSASSVRRPDCASAVATLTAVVLLPTPPLKFARQIVFPLGTVPPSRVDCGHCATSVPQQQCCCVRLLRLSSIVATELCDIVSLFLCCCAFMRLCNSVAPCGCCSRTMQHSCAVPLLPCDSVTYQRPIGGRTCSRRVAGGPLRRNNATLQRTGPAAITTGKRL